MTALPALVTIPAHPFEVAKRADLDGLGGIEDRLCGYHHHIDDETGVICAKPGGHPVHAGRDTTVRVREWTDEEIEAMNR